MAGMMPRPRAMGAHSSVYKFPNGFVPAPQGTVAWEKQQELLLFYATLHGELNECEDIQGLMQFGGDHEDSLATAKSNLAEARRKVVNALGWIIVDDQDAQLPAPVADVEEGVNTWLNLPHNASMVLDAYAKVGAQPPPPAPPVQAPPRPPAQAPARPYLADPFDIPYHPADLLFHPPLPQAPQQRPPTQQSPAPPPPEVRNEPSSSRTRRRPRGNDDEASSSSSRQRRGGD